MKTITLFSLRVFAGTTEESLRLIERYVALRKPKIIFTPNLYHLALLSEDARFKKIYTQADLLLIDGISLVWLIKLLYHKNLERINGTNLVLALIKESVQKGYKIFFLGSTDAVQRKLKEVLKREYPKLQFQQFAPPIRDCFSSADMEEMSRKIKRHHPDILLVGFGAPKQELFLFYAKRRLGVPVGIGVGGAFEYLAGVKRRAPQWVQNVGLEWLFRLLREPRRLWTRYLLYDLRFLVRTVKGLMGRYDAA